MEGSIHIVTRALISGGTQVRETFPSHKMIEVLCDYVVDLLRSKQADQV